MYPRVLPLIDRLEAQINGSNQPEIAADFVFPLPVQFCTRMSIVPNAAFLISALALYKAQIVARGLVHSSPTIVAMDIPQQGRFRLWVDWTYPIGTSPDAPRTKTLFYCSDIAGNVQVEMVHFLQVGARNLSVDTFFADARPV